MIISSILTDIWKEETELAHMPDNCTRNEV